MADKNIAELPELAAVTDDTLIPVWQPGAEDEAQSMTGKQFREFAEASVTPYSAAVRADAVLAENAKNAAQSALSGVQTAIQNIPAGSTPIVNDLTTGGVTMALSAEQGKVLRQIISALTAADVGAYSLLRGEAIQANADLNDYITPGSYICQTTAIAKTILNSPVTSTGYSIQVEIVSGASSNYLHQTLHANNATADVYKRRYHPTSGWGEWYKIATNADLTAENIGAVSDTGDTMTGALAIKLSTATLQMTADGSSARLAAYVNWAKRKFIHIPTDNSVSPYNNLQYVDMDADGNGNSARYDILHTGNKPSGSYTGNGSAAIRTINTGGIGSAVAIWSLVGNAIVLHYGVLAFSSTSGVEALSSNVAHFRDGVLTIAGNSPKLNENGVTYYYQVL